jgi:hypothetical protein
MHHRAASGPPVRFARHAVEPLSQSGRESADVLTINRPDGPIGQSFNGKQESDALAAFQYPKRQADYQGYRSGPPDRTGLSMPVLIGAALIAVSILLSALISIAGTRFISMDSPTEDSVWLIDRLTGSVYRCQAADHGKASCDPDTATGSIGQPKR